MMGSTVMASGRASTVALAGTGAWPPIAGLNGPGRLNPYDPASAMIFDTAADVFAGDALARFFEDELWALDWRADYMMELEPIGPDEEEGPSFKTEAEPEEEVYDKKALTTTESDSGWDIT